MKTRLVSVCDVTLIMSTMSVVVTMSMVVMAVTMITVTVMTVIIFGWFIGEFSQSTKGP